MIFFFFWVIHLRITPFTPNCSHFIDRHNIKHGCVGSICCSPFFCYIHFFFVCCALCAVECPCVAVYELCLFKFLASFMGRVFGDGAEWRDITKRATRGGEMNMLCSFWLRRQLSAACFMLLHLCFVFGCVCVWSYSTI